MTLSWTIEDDRLVAAHPHFHDGGSPLCYRVHEETGYCWIAKFEGRTVTQGPLAQVLVEVEKDAGSPTGIPIAITRDRDPS